MLSFLTGGRKARAAKKIFLTFDDGYKDFLDLGLPVLKKHEFSALISVVTDCCDRSESGKRCRNFRLPTVSWKEVQEMYASGMEIASHGLTHKRLTRIPLEERQQEITGSKKEIERRLGASITTFCYPFGDHDKDTAGIVSQAGYALALTTNMGLVKSNDDAQMLKRITIDEDLSLIEFKALMTPAAEWYYRLRGFAIRE
jgi:peptidoglycan/xylan/chitin deacetylase (PgdA/CDA1 family)